MLDLEQYESRLQFIKFKNGDTILTNIFYHKKSDRLFVLNPMKMITTEKDGIQKISFTRWLPLAEDTVLYEIDPLEILTSGTPSEEFIELYTDNVDAEDYINDLIN